LTKRWVPWCLLPIGVLAHLPALGNGFVLDDGILFVRNPYLRSLAGLGELLKNELFVASAEVRYMPYYRPLSGLLYWLSYQLFGTSAPLQHALNLLLHGLIGVALAQVLLAAGARLGLAVGAAALFAVHPATPEIVAYVGGRQDMLGWLIVLGAWCWCELRGASAGARGAAVFAAALLSALAREFFVATPLLLFAALVPAATNRRQHAVAIALGGALGVLVVFGLRQAIDVEALQLATPGVTDVLVTAAAVALRLLKLLFWPSDVAMEVTLPRLGLLSALAVLSALALTTALSLVWLFKRVGAQARLAAFGWATLWAAVALHTPICLKYGTVSDRYAYEAVLAAVCIAVPALGQLDLRLPIRPALAKVMLCLLLAAPLPVTWARDAEWRSEATLQVAMYRDRPDDPEAQFAEGMRLFRLEEYDAAYPLCVSYQKVSSHAERAGLCVGTILLLRQQPALAARHLEAYARPRPGSVEARVRLFQAWFAANDLEGVRRGLEFFSPYGPDAADIVAARKEYEKRVR